MVLRLCGTLMPLSALTRYACGSVPPLVIREGDSFVLATRASPTPLLPLQAQQVQRTAHLLHRHLRIFPPAVAACARRQSSALAGTASGASSAPCNSSPHSA